MYDQLLYSHGLCKAWLSPSSRTRRPAARSGDPASTETPSPPRSLGSSALSLPSRLGPAFRRQREDLITPISGNIASKSFKWFQKTSVIVSRGRVAISPFCLQNPWRSLARRAPGNSQQKQNLRVSPGWLVGAAVIPLPSHGSAHSQSQHTTRGNACASGSGRPTRPRQDWVACPKPQTVTGSCTHESETPGSAAGPAAEPELPRSITLGSCHPLSSSGEYWGSLFPSYPHCS